jgi:hypothetical protein
MWRTLALGAMGGGAVAWVWGAISWGVLPWHHATFLPFTDEDDAARVFLTLSPRSGVYGLPSPPRHRRSDSPAARAAADRAAQQRMSQGPIVTAIVRREGFGSVPLAMLRAFVIHAIAAGLLTAGAVCGRRWGSGWRHLPAAGLELARLFSRVHVGVGG